MFTFDGQGLTPSIFWQHKDILLRTDRFDLDALVHDLVSQSSSNMRQEHWESMPSPVPQMHGRLMVGALSDLPACLPPTLPGSQNTLAYVILSSNVDQTIADSEPAKQKDVLNIQLAEGKRGQATFLETVLPQAIPFIDSQLSRGATICICGESGKDASVGLALAASQLLFNDEGEYVDDQNRCTCIVPVLQIISMIDLVNQLPDQTNLRLRTRGPSTKDCNGSSPAGRRPIHREQL